jgi:hypothetical protein
VKEKAESRLIMVPKNQVETLSASEWTPQEAAARIVSAWQGAVNSIIETGRILIEAKERVPHGQWLTTIELLPFSEGTARKLMAIAEHPDLANRSHGNDLPASWTTLYILAQLPPGEIPRLIESHQITPELERATAQEWVNLHMASQQMAFNDWSNFCDNLTHASCYVKNFKPPSPIPAGYLSVDEAKRLNSEISKVMEGWGKHE